MPMWNAPALDELLANADLIEIARAPQAVLHVIGTTALVVLRCSTEPEFQSPFVNRTRCRPLFPDDTPSRLKQQLDDGLRCIEKWCLASDCQHGVVPVRLCDEPVSSVVVCDKAVALQLNLTPPLTRKEWQLLGNPWRFRLNVNCELVYVNADADIERLQKRLRSMESYLITVDRYEGDFFSVVTDRHGSTVAYMDSDGESRRFAVNTSIPEDREYVTQQVDEIGEATEVDAHFLVSRDVATEALTAYLRHGSVETLEPQ